jgi:hypothetical protein
MTGSSARTIQVAERRSWRVPTDTKGRAEQGLLVRRRGLDVISSRRHGQVLDDDTHWQEIRALNEDVVQEVHTRGLQFR